MNCSLESLYANANYTTLTGDLVCNIGFGIGQYVDQQVSVSIVPDLSVVLNETNPVDNTVLYLSAPMYAMYKLGNMSFDGLLVLEEIDSIQGVKSPLFAFTILTFNFTDTQYVIVDAEECAVGFCLRDYDVFVKNNTQHGSRSDARYGKSFHRNPDNDGGLGYCWSADDEIVPTSSSTKTSGCVDDQDGSCTNSDPAQLMFCVRAFFDGYQNVWQDMITDPFGGTITSAVTTGPCGSPNGSTFTCAKYDGANHFSPLGSDLVEGAPAQVERVIEFSIDTLLGSIVESLNLLNKQTYPTWVEGYAGSPGPHVHVRWAWLSLPLTLILAGTALLVWTMLDAKRNKYPLWKGSVLALLFHGLGSDQLRDRDIPDTTSRMEVLADEILSVLKFDEIEGRTALVTSGGNELKDTEGVKKRV